jgi:hypothetical protein
VSTAIGAAMSEVHRSILPPCGARIATDPAGGGDQCGSRRPGAFSKTQRLEIRILVRHVLHPFSLFSQSHGARTDARSKGGACRGDGSRHRGDRRREPDLSLDVARLQVAPAARSRPFASGSLSGTMRQARSSASHRLAGAFQFVPQFLPIGPGEALPALRPSRSRRWQLKVGLRI